MPESVQKKSGKQRLVIKSVAIGAVLFIASSSTASAFDLPGPLKTVWNATVGRVSSTFTNITNEYFGSLIDKYLPEGISKVFGELGLPDPAGIFADIRDTAKNGNQDVNFYTSDTDFSLDTISGERKINDVSGDVAETFGSAFFSENAQKANADANKAMAQTVEGSQEAANQTLKLTKTQEVLKLQSQQLSQITAAMGNVSQRIAQGNQQQAAQTMAASAIAKNANEEKRREDVRAQEEVQDIAESASFFNGLFDK